jgi:single stranded DNA-binding protein
VSGITARFTGRLGRDAKLRYTAAGKPMLAFSVAIDDDRRTAGDPTQWVRVACFGDQAEQLDGCLSKGDQVRCEGLLVVKLWQGRPDLELYAWSVEAVGVRRPSRWRRPQAEPIALGTGSAGRAGRNTRQAIGLDDVDEDGPF